MGGYVGGQAATGSLNKDARPLTSHVTRDRSLTWDNPKLILKIQLCLFD